MLPFEHGASRPVVCIYHAKCPDGFTAAWAVFEAALGYAEVEFVPADYGCQPPDVSGKDVIIVDFSYPRDVLVEMSQSANSVLVLDHHKTAREALEGLFPEGDIDEIRDAYNERLMDGGEEPFLTGIFDMEKSGARLAWEFFHEGAPIPELVRYVEDRDLWLHQLPDTVEINAYIMSLNFDFDEWGVLWDELSFSDARNEIVERGKALHRMHHKYISEHLPAVTIPMVIGGHQVPAANLPHMFASDAADHLYKLEPEAPFMAIYFDGPKGRKVSLRTRRGSTTDVSQIARSYGGGGHAAAASFIKERGWLGEEQ